MKGILRLSVTLLFCIGSIQAEAGSKDESTKPQFNSINSLSTIQKSPDAISYQFGARFQPQAILNQLKSQDGLNYQQLERKQPVQQTGQLHQTPVAMVIIAQPVYMPASMLQQSNIAQQLLHYFGGHAVPRSNYPQLYQHQYPSVPQYSNVNHHLRHLVHHYQQPEVPSPSPSSPPPQIAPLQTQSQSSSASTNFQQQHQSESLPTPQALIAPHSPLIHNHLPGQERKILPYQSAIHPNHQYHQQPIPPNHKPDYQQQQPYELNHISQLAQQAAQRYLMSGGAGGPAGAAGAPAIITGLENFSPEHQQKIKAQLSTYFGAPLQPLNFDENQKSEGKSYQESNKQQQKIHSSTSDKFVPSIEVKNGEITQINAQNASEM